MKLNRSLTFRDIVILAFGTMIGWGWIMLAGGWVEKAGFAGAIVAFCCGAVLCIFVGLAYAELSAALPLAGGEMVFTYRALGYRASWFTGWMITFAYIGVAAWEGPALATAIDYLIGIPKYGYMWTVAGYDVYISWLLVAIVAGLAITVINVCGVKQSAVFQAIATASLGIGGIAFLLGSVAKGDYHNIFPTFTSVSGLVAVLLMVPSMFVGFDVIPQVAEEMNIKLGKLKKAIILAIGLATLWYVGMIVAVAFAAPKDLIATASIPAADAFTFAVGAAWAGKFLVVVGVFGILTSWNGFLLGAARVLFAMGRAKMLPSCFERIGRRSKIPYISIIFVGVISCISPLLGKNALVWFVDSSAFGTVIAYFLVSLSFLVLRKKEPEMERPVFVRAGTFVGVMAVIVSVGFISLYLPFGLGALTPIEWLFVGGWLALGAALYAINSVRTREITDAQREALIMGGE